MSNAETNEEFFKEQIEQLEHFILLLKSGSCWCGVGIGNPMYKDHSGLCKVITEYFKENDVLEKYRIKEKKK